MLNSIIDFLAWKTIKMVIYNILHRSLRKIPLKFWHIHDQGYKIYQSVGKPMVKRHLQLSESCSHEPRNILLLFPNDYKISLLLPHVEIFENLI